jgi:hypothetical protein
MYLAGQDVRMRIEDDLIAAKEALAGYEGTIESLESELERFHDINQALADENRDLVRRVELLDAVLYQLQIPVKLPAKKSRG